MAITIQTSVNPSYPSTAFQQAQLSMPTSSNDHRITFNGESYDLDKKTSETTLFRELRPVLNLQNQVRLDLPATTFFQGPSFSLTWVPWTHSIQNADNIFSDICRQLERIFKSKPSTAIVLEMAEPGDRIAKAIANAITLYFPQIKSNFEQTGTLSIPLPLFNNLLQLQEENTLGLEQFYDFETHQRFPQEYDSKDLGELLLTKLYDKYGSKLSIYLEHAPLESLIINRFVKTWRDKILQELASGQVSPATLSEIKALNRLFHLAAMQRTEHIISRAGVLRNDTRDVLVIMGRQHNPLESAFPLTIQNEAELTANTQNWPTFFYPFNSIINAIANQILSQTGYSSDEAYTITLEFLSKITDDSVQILINRLSENNKLGKYSTIDIFNDWVAYTVDPTQETRFIQEMKKANALPPKL